MSVSRSRAGAGSTEEGHSGGGREPRFLHGTEVAEYGRRSQPGFADQLSLLSREPEIKRKLFLAAGVILGVFFMGMISGAVVGFFV